MSMNECKLHGYLGRDPELKATPGGATLCRFSVATTENWKDKDGNKKSKTEWHNIVAWNKQAESIEKFFKKGSEILLTGKIEYTQADNPADSTKKITYTHIRLISFEFCGKKGDGNSTGGYQEPDPEAPEGYESDNSGSSNSQTSTGTTSGSYEDDIPF